MSSEPSKTWNHVRLLQAASEGLRSMGDLYALQKKERKAERKKGESASLSLEKEEQKEDVGQEESPSSPELPNTTESEGMDEERLAKLRSHLQAQLSIREQAEDPSSDGQLMKLVENIVHGEDDTALPVSNNESLEGRSTFCTLCDDPTSHSSGLSMEVKKALQRELAELKDEVVASIETMKTEVMEEIHNLHESLHAYNDHHFFQDLSPLKELDENAMDQLKGGRYRISQGGKLGNHISQEEKFKSRSVPTLHPLHASNRNQAMLRAVNAMTAKNGFFSSLSRSNSDPVEPVQAQSIVLPPPVPKSATKKHLRKMAPPSTTKTYSSNGKYGGKMGSKMAQHHLPCESSEDKPH